MNGCTHAELMLLYAQDAARMKRPFEHWEFQNSGSTQWKRCLDHPSWKEEVQYRRRAPTHMLNAFEVPEPMQEVPKIGAPYHMVNMEAESWFSELIWHNDKFDNRLFQRGLIFHSAEAAIANAKAMCGIDPHAA